MNTYTNHPNFDSFVENEFKTLTYLINRGGLDEYSDLYNAIILAEAEYRSAFKAGRLKFFDFHAKFSMKVEGSDHGVLIGGKVTENFQECSYFLAITDRDDPDQLIRKFHFDYAQKDNATHQKVPSFHLQYGGKMSPKMQEEGFKDDKLDHWLSLPRLNFQPINLALLLDIMFCEFRTEDTTKIVESSEWRTLIFDNERFLSKNYFDTISHYLNSQEYKQSKLLRDFCYS